MEFSRKTQADHGPSFRAVSREKANPQRKVEIRRKSGFSKPFANFIIEGDGI